MKLLQPKGYMHCYGVSNPAPIK